MNAEAGVDLRWIWCLTKKLTRVYSCLGSCRSCRPRWTDLCTLNAQATYVRSLLQEHNSPGKAATY